MVVPCTSATTGWRTVRTRCLVPAKTVNTVDSFAPSSRKHFQRHVSRRFPAASRGPFRSRSPHRTCRTTKEFLIELGRDFCFVGSQYLLQVGGRDFYLDLLFFHRGLQSLVAIELKIEEFQPEHLGKLEFYLEALDRDVRKPHEKPSIGVLLCATKDHEVVEYALSRATSPALVAEYQTALPDKKLLQAKLTSSMNWPYPKSNEQRNRGSCLQTGDGRDDRFRTSFPDRNRQIAGCGSF